MPAADGVERKFNPNHDPANGQFTSGPGGPGKERGYRGMTVRGLGMVRPVSAEASTTIGRQPPGKPFFVHLIGSKPFSARGRR